MSKEVTPIHYRDKMVDAKSYRFDAKLKLAQKLKRGTIVEVTNIEQARIAEEAEARCILVQYGTSQMANPYVIKEIKRAVCIPMMASVRVGHFVEAQIMEQIGVDYIDESELLGFADYNNYINKHYFHVPFACRGQNPLEALTRVSEGATIIWLEGGMDGYDSCRSGNIADTVQVVRSEMEYMETLADEDEEELFTFADMMGLSYDVVAQIKETGKLPAVQLAAGGIATPADAALTMQLGSDGVLLGSDVFGSLDPYKQVRAIVQAVKYYDDPCILAESSSGLEDPETDDDWGLTGYFT